MLVLAACDGDGQACTTEFAFVTVYLEDAAAAPVTDAALTAVLLRTGDTLPVLSLVDLAAGHYVVVDDGALDRLGTSRDSLAVSVRRGPTEITLGFAVRDDGCHVQKLAGPDTATVP